MDTIAERYTTLTDEELHSCIAAAKATLGSKLVVLGHHYQSDDVIQYADFRGAKLRGAVLQESKLGGSRGELDLSGFNFQGMNFRGAKFYQIDFRNTNFQGADLTRVEVWNWADFECSDNNRLEYRIIEDF